MFRSNLKIILRQFRNIYSFLNLTGLTIGLTVFTLIFLWVNDELSYDRFHANNKEIYRILGDQTVEGQKHNLMATTCAPLAEYLKTNFEEIKESCRVRGVEFFLKYNEEGFYKKGLIADPSFFKIFTFPLRQGSLSSFEEGANKIIISQQLAETYFGQSDAIGKVFVIAGTDVQVVGVMENVPTNSHLQFDYVVPLEFVKTIRMYSLDSWDLYFVSTYIKTTVTVTDIYTFENKIKNVINKNSPEAATSLRLQPLVNIHLKSSDINNDIKGHGNIVYVYSFASIAIFILIIASINYSNLATARSIKRSKETGVRKVMGSSRFQLASFFFSESIFYCLIAFAIALLLSWLLLPNFNSLAGKQLVFHFLSPTIIGSLLFFTFLCALLGGIYPALVLSGQNPVIVFKGMAKAGGKAILFRRVLVVFQFILSIGLLTGTLVVKQQLDYIAKKELGYEKDKVIAFSMVRKIRSNYATIKNELLALPAVKSVTANSANISFNDSWTDELVWPGKKPDEKRIFYQFVVDPDFLKTYNISLASGRDFSSEMVSDSSALLINEEAASQMGIVNPVGTAIKLHDIPYTIIGVVKNFHFKSIHKKIEPLIMFIDPMSFFQTSIKLNAGNLPEQIKSIEAIFKKLTPERPFDYTFVDEDIEKLYLTDNRTGKIFTYFSAFAIFISCLGLLGIILFVTEQRAKELAVRKVLGAPVFKLMKILSLEYVIMAGIGFCIEAPLMYYVMGKWLSNFAYRSELNIWVFLLAGLLTLLIAWLTVAYRSFQAATDNPVKSLRSE